jgi:nitrate reductase NapE component
MRDSTLPTGPQKYRRSSSRIWSTPSGQPTPGDGPFEGGPSFAVLHPSLDAHDSRSQITSWRRYAFRLWPAVVVALVGGRCRAYFDCWAIESGQGPDYASADRTRVLARQWSWAWSSARVRLTRRNHGRLPSADETAGNGPVKKTLCRASQYGVKGDEDRSISRSLCSANEAYRAGIFREFPIVGQQRNALHSRLGHKDAIERVLVPGR